tara:strand:+ start:7825 stop:8148 length:324 start_codon:yes stop_codon:yes gene_type:complete
LTGKPAHEKYIADRMAKYWLAATGLKDAGMVSAKPIADETVKNPRDHRLPPLYKHIEAAGWGRVSRQKYYDAYTDSCLNRARTATCRAGGLVSNVASVMQQLPNLHR